MTSTRGRRLPVLFVVIAILELAPSTPAGAAVTGIALGDPVALTGFSGATTSIRAWFFDATGDGVADAVWQTGSSVSIWPYANGVFTTTATQISLVPDPQSVAWFEPGDVNGDGRMDLVYSDGVEILVAFQQAGGTFDTPSVAFSEATGTRQALGDVDGDGTADLIVEHWTGTAFEVHQVDDSSGTWSDTSLGIPGSANDQIMLGDLNHDGLIDIVTSDGSSTSASVRKANGTYAAPVVSNVAGSDLAELNGDHHPDLFRYNGYFPGDGAGGFGAFIEISASSGSWTLMDVNGDGTLDLFIGISGLVAFQRPNGTWATPCPLFRFPNVYAGDPIGAHDMNGDGHPELFVPSYGPSSALDVYPGSTLGTAVLSAGVTPSPLAYGQRATVTGQIWPDRICPATSLAGSTLELWRSDDGGPMAKVATTTAGADTTYTLSDKPPNAGHYDYEVRFPGDATHSPATYPEVAVDVPAAGALALRFSSPQFAYGADAFFRVRLKPFSVTSDRSVELFTRRPGHTFRYWKTVKVSASTGVYDGAIASIAAPVELKARWAGDDVWPHEAVTDEAAVHVAMSGRLLKTAGRQGTYALYRSGQNVFFAAIVNPAIVAKEYVELDHEGGTHWYRKASGSFKPNAQGVLVIGIPARALRVGEHYRISARHPGGHGLNPWSTRWKYFKVVKTTALSARPGPPARVAKELLG